MTPEEVEALEPAEREALRRGPFQPGDRVRLEAPVDHQDEPFLGWVGEYRSAERAPSTRSVVRWTATGGLQGGSAAGGAFLVSTAALRLLLPGEDPGTEQPPPGRPEVLRGYGL